MNMKQEKALFYLKKVVIISINNTYHMIDATIPPILRASRNPTNSHNKIFCVIYNKELDVIMDYYNYY